MDEADTKAADAPAPVTDTADDSTSDASQSELDAPEATQVVEEKQTTEVKAEDTAEEQLLAGKYKSPEELEKAYKELESKYGTAASDKAELTRVLNEAFTAPPVADEDTAETFDDDTTVNPEIERLKQGQAITEFMFKYPDADGTAMNEVLSKDPMMDQISGYNAKLEYAYLRSQAMSREQALSEAQKEGQNQATAKLAEKEVAQVESAKTATPIDEGAELMEQATSGTPEERDKARKALIRKHLINL